MASIARDPNGRKRLLFHGSDGKRRCIRLGKVTQRQAESIKLRVENLVSASLTGHACDDETARWVASLSNALHDKLAAAGLVVKRQSATLAAFLDEYLESRKDIKASTRLVLGHTQRCLVEYFGAEKPLRDITRGDADRWRTWLISDQELADNTVRRRCGIAKQYFKAAQRSKLVSINAFDDLTAAVRANPQRFHFVSREVADRVSRACPDAEWRLLFALARYGGIRIPSEAVGLQWSDVDWARGRLTITSPKTEHHPGQGSRVIPIFAELSEPLLEVYSKSSEGADRVFTNLVDAKQNLRTRFNKIIRRAGLEPWPKLWQNLRSSRETELAESWPMHVVCAWIGNSQAVAQKHYLQVTDEHFERALSEKAAQNAAQHSAASEGVEMHGEFGQFSKCLSNGDLQRDANQPDELAMAGMGDEGLEPPTSSL